jgi:hypothetical protein
MALIDNEDVNVTFKNLELFKEKLQTLNDKLPAILDDFKKYYVFFYENQENDEYKNSFENIKSNLTQIKSDLIILSNGVNSSTNELNEKLLKLDLLIKQEKKINSELKSKLGIVEDKNNAASELLHDYKYIYSEEYMRNWALFLGILIVVGSIAKINRNYIS